MKYIRYKACGGSYFFTVVTEGRQRLFANDEYVTLLREAFCYVKEKRSFIMEAVVILPDHLHCIWTLPEGDDDFSTRWRLIKTWFTKHCDEKYKLTRNQSRIKKQQQAVWQHRFWEHYLRDEKDFNSHVDYIHYNPVKHGYVNKPSDWKYSSIHRYIRSGVLTENWGGEVNMPDGTGHE